MFSFKTEVFICVGPAQSGPGLNIAILCQLLGLRQIQWYFSVISVKSVLLSD